MEPREEERKVEESRPEERKPAKQRFRIVRLEERVAPSTAQSGFRVMTPGPCPTTIPTY